MRAAISKSAVLQLIAPNFLVFAGMGVSAILFSAVTLGGFAYFNAKRTFLRPDRPPNTWEAYINYKAQYAIESSEANDIVFFGDSTCLQDIDTLRFQSRTNLKAYNLGTVGIMGIDGIEVLARLYLHHHPKPIALVLCLAPVTLGKPPTAFGPEYVRERFFRSFDQWNMLKSPLNISWIDKIRQGAGSIRGRVTGQYKEYNDTLFGGDNPQGDMTYNSLEAEVVAARGYWPLPGKLDQDMLRDVDKNEESFPVFDSSELAIASLVRFTLANHIIPILSLSPVLQGTSDESFPSIHRMFDDLSRECPGVVIAHRDVLQYDFSQLGDKVHCNSAGAERFTDVISNEIMAELNRKKTESTTSTFNGDRND